MSAKWRALQHRHRYTYGAVVFPPSFSATLNQSSLSASSPPFYHALQELLSLDSTYSQLSHAKNVAATFTDLLQSHSKTQQEPLKEQLVSEAARFYLEILFMENSLPLHRTLVGVLSKTRNFQSVILDCFRQLCDEYGSVFHKGKPFCVSRVALSVMSMPKLGYLVDAIEDCALLVARDIVHGLNGVVLETREWARPSPIVMEQCQEALSCLYYLLQRFPAKFRYLGLKDSDTMEVVVGVLLSILKSEAFSRDCFVAAGVSFFAGLQVCLSAEELGRFIVQGIFGQSTCGFDTNDGNGLEGASNKMPYKGDILLEIGSLSTLSRLCLTRGILTAVSRSIITTPFLISRDSSSGCCSHENGSCSTKTILFDGILPELCNYCENPTDSHFNFHALTVMQICFQQIKTAMLADITNSSEDHDPMPENMGTRILRIIWNNLEDPLSQTVKQVHHIFDLFLDIQYTLHSAKGNEKIKSFLGKIASDLLRLGPRCKGRYVPLALLTKRLGAKSVLGMSPNLLFETVEAYIDDDVCCAATSFLKCFLEYLRDECWSSDGVENGYWLYRGYCLPPILHGLASGISKLRSNLNTYALPALLEVDVDGIFPMLAFVSVGPSEEVNEIVHSKLDLTKVELRVEQKVAVLVSLLKVSRSLALIEGDIDLCNDTVTSIVDNTSGTRSLNAYAYICVKGIKVTVPVRWFVLALTHMDESLRVDAAETLFLNPKTSSLPSQLELTLMKKAVPLNMRSSSTGFQMKWTSLFRKFFSRVRTALERQVKMHGLRPHMNHEDYEVFTPKTTEKVDFRAEGLSNFMRWLSCFLFFSCYPSAPYKRKIMAMELILIMLNIWPILPSQENIDLKRCPSPYNAGITSPDSTLLLVGSVVDSWDRLRESSFRILLHFPTPLPGISEENMVHKVITWAKELVCSPRVRESDAGALTLRLLFRKYVLDLGWIVGASVNIVCYPLTSGISKPRHPVMEYIQSLIDWLDFTVKEGEKDLSEACKNSFVHGVLLALRYTFEELDWNSDAVLSTTSGMRTAVSKLLDLVMRITSLALWVVSSDAWYLPDDVEEMIDDDDALLLDGPEEMDVPRPQFEHEEKSSKALQDGRPPEHIVMVGCWLAMKEVSLLLGTIIRKIPLPSNSSSDSSKFDSPLSGAPDILTTTLSDEVLNLKQLEKIGSHFLEVLLKMKHNGAIDKTRAGFTALCNRLLCSNDPRLCKLTESWMEQLMERTVAKGQIVDDLLRRSAGIPAAFTALFLSEPEGAPKKLLPKALRWLIDLADGSLLKQAESSDTYIPSFPISSTKSKQGTDLSFDMGKTEKITKIRDEGVIPTVHAFNVLRAAFNDTNLATDTSGFAAEALIISIRSFSSPYWEVRNSACLAYTALIRRMIGFLNVQKRESARRALTGLEFFHRHPLLHPFLFNELNIATELLGNALTGRSESNLLKVVHPSLCPMLILLSRLKPSPMASETGDDLDPFLFMPFIRKCSIQSNLRIRVLASRALTGLVSNEKLPIVILNIASELPHSEEQVAEAQSSTISVPPANGRHQPSFNLIHGVLLQLDSLLDGNCRNLTDILKKNQILGNLIEILAMSSWIGSPKRCPCPILNSCFLRVLDHMLGIARTCYISNNFYAIQRLLLESSIECLDLGASYSLPCYDPTTAELRQQAATSYLNCIFQASDEVGEELLQLPKKFSPPEPCLWNVPRVENNFAGLVERLTCSLTDSSYEVRLVTLKWLLKFLKSRTYGNMHEPSTEIRSIKTWAKTELQATLIRHLQTEKHHRCTYYILRIIFTWNLLNTQESGKGKCSQTVSVGAMECDTVFELWDKLMSLYKLSRHSKTREALICCMAICVKKFAALFASLDEQKTLIYDESWQTERSARFYDCITVFVNIIKQHSSSSEPVNMRKVAAESIVACGLLEQAEFIALSICNRQNLSENSLYGANNYAYLILEIWFTCMKLLEDEDDGIRQKLAEDVRKCIFVISSRGDFTTREAPTQVEKIMELSFDYLSASFGHWIEYYDYLLRWVIDAANYVLPKGDLVRRVFHKEVDNHHEEKLLICQICCSHLENIGITQLNGDELLKYLQEWRMRFCGRLMSFVKDHRGKLGAEWIGGVGNHKDAFLPLYANLLGCYALSKCIFNMELKAEDHMNLLMNVLEVGRAIDPFLGNPLISNLYLVLVRLHEGGQTTDQSHSKDLIWLDFDPYFLLG